MRTRASRLHNRFGSLYVVSGPSASGKTTILREICSDDDIWFSVSATTRSKRHNEVDGRDYFFMTEQDFRSDIEQGKFFEYATVHGNLYGTPREPVMERLRRGIDVALDIDVQGARQVRKTFNNAILIYILPPSREILEERLRGRGTESEESIQRRLEVADSEVCESRLFDYLIVNDDLDESVGDMECIMRARSLAMPDGGVYERWHPKKQKS
ncbi:MAG: guanylate kinase [Planctomycetota bacterium]|nr:guanylate kinase [Planctomycetota bacterium]